MLASAALIAFAMAQLGPPVAIPQKQLHVSWNQSPSGAGGSLLGYGPEQIVVMRFDTWTAMHPQTEDYIQLQANAGQPSLLLNTRSGVIQTGVGQAPSRPDLPGFVLTASSATPFMLQFTCQDAVTAQGWRNNGAPLVITITP